MSLRVLQWNCRSVFSALTDLNHIVSKTRPDIILLEETWLAPGRPFRFHNYRIFRLDRPTRGGGLLTLVSPQFCHKAHLSFQLMSVESEILAVTFNLPGCTAFSLVNAYFPDGVTSTSSLDAALSACEKRVVLCGDFNSHHVSWGFRTDACGRRLCDWMRDNNLYCFNSGTVTFFRCQTSSVLDLTLSNMGNISSWSTWDQATSSDHIPILYELLCPSKTPREHIVRHINYHLVQKEVKSALRTIESGDEERRAAQVASILSESVKKSHFVVCSKKDGGSSPWWNEECSRAYSHREAAWKKVLKNQCPSNWTNYKFAAAIFKRIVSKAKENYNTEKFASLSKPKNRRMLYRYLRSRKVVQDQSNNNSLVQSTRESTETLERIAQELESRFSSGFSLPFVSQFSNEGFTPVTRSELADIVLQLSESAPGSDGITVSMLKFLFKESPDDLLNIVNTSLKNSWIPSGWKLAKIVPLLKNDSLGFVPDNIRPISLTSNLVKLVERILHGRLMRSLNSNNILSAAQIGFRPGNSIWMAHVDIDSRIKLARRLKQVSALVTLDIAKAYDSVEYRTLMPRLESSGIPGYIRSWIGEFLKGRKFFCSRDGLSTSQYHQFRGVPQGSVLSPVIFNILLSSIPIQKDISTYVYADDIAFFSSDRDIQELYQRLQNYLTVLDNWLSTLHLSLNVRKCAVIVFPINNPISLCLTYRLQFIRQVKEIKYLGIIYDDHLTWRPHISHIALKGEKAAGVLRRISNHKFGMRRDTLLMIYRSYVRPVLEFGCVLFSGCATYKLHPLFLIERLALRLCLGLPKYVANSVLYLEARFPPLLHRFKLLTVLTFLRLFESPLNQAQPIFLVRPDLFQGITWPRFDRPQLDYAQAWLQPLHADLFVLRPHCDNLSPVEISLDNIFPSNAKLLPARLLNSLLKDHLATLNTHVVIATDASQRDEKAGVGIYSQSLDWSFSIRLPDYTPIFQAELLAIILALKKLQHRFADVVILADSLSVCTALITEKDTPILRSFRSLVPQQLRKIRLVWVPGHAGIVFNELADQLASLALDGPVVVSCPTDSFLLGARFRRLQFLQMNRQDALCTRSDYIHLSHSWKPQYCESRKCEVTITKFRCRIPPLNFYLHKSGQALSPHCPYCNDPETLEHFLLNCRSLSSMRRTHLEYTFNRLNLPLSTTAVLSLGASMIGVCHRDVVLALHSFVAATGRLSC